MGDAYTLSLVTGPGEPVSLVEVKSHSRIDMPDDDVLLSGLITAARQKFDGRDAWYGRALMTQTWDLFLPRFPCAPDVAYDSMIGISVPLPPLQSVTSITYTDPAGNPQTLAGSEYVVDTKCEPGRIVPAYGKGWPATRDVVNAVAVRFVAGYGTSSTTVPQEIRDWIKQAVDYRYLNRGATDLPSSFYWSLASYKVTWQMPTASGLRSERITFQRHDTATDAWLDLSETPEMWAAVEAFPGGRYGFRILYRQDLENVKAMLPALRIQYGNLDLDVEDVIETETGAELQIIAQVVVVEIGDLGSTARRTSKVWP
jgi:uncharacterized phiE125 gp8 family phage protein